MHIQGREFRFEDLNITVAYFADEPDMDFDEKVPNWLGDDCPFDDSFSDFESFTLREGGGVLIVAASNLTAKDMKLVNELVTLSNDDQIRLLVCSERKRYPAPQFNAVISSNYDLVNSIYDLAFSFYTGSGMEDGTRNISELDAVIRQSRKGILVSYWDDRKNKNLITPYDLAEQWPFSIDEASKVVGMYTWLNPANCRWSAKTINRFVRFGGDEMTCKRFHVSSCSSYEPEFSRKPMPDVIQIIML